MPDNGHNHPENLTDWLAERLPPITRQEIQQYREAAARGEFVDAADAFAEASGCSREEWLKKLEAHVAKYPREKKGRAT